MFFFLPCSKCKLVALHVEEARGLEVCLATIITPQLIRENETFLNRTEETLLEVMQTSQASTKKKAT